MSKKQMRIILITILVAASLLRLWGLSRGDMLNDEVTYSLRAIGLVDYFNEPSQTTPLMWFDPSPPWWTKISFHDHPPLVFLVQYLFISVFGENAIAFRLPSVILGVLSVWLVFLLGRRLFSEGAGLVAAALTAVTLSQVFISRVGMQEVYVIFFTLLASLLFLKSLENEKYFIPWGITLGLAFLTKYTAFILVPIFGIYLLFAKPAAFLNKKFWLGCLFALLLFTPVLVYNVELYRAVGHFDFQFSYLLRQHPKEWPLAPGRTEVGTLSDRIRDFAPHLIESNSWPFLAIFAASILAFLVMLFRRPRETLGKYGFLVTTFFYFALLLLLIGPTYRFLTLLVPFMAISAAAFLWWVYQKFFVGKVWPAPLEASPDATPGLPRFRRGPLTGLAVFLFMLIIGFEVFYSYNNQIAYYPKGTEPWLASKVRYENYNVGYRELGEYLDKEMKGKMPGVVFDSRYSFLLALQESAIERAKAEGREPLFALFVYYDNFDLGPRLWILDRLLVYHGWPVMNFGAYSSVIQENGRDYFNRAGIKQVYFIQRTNIVPSPEFLSEVKAATPIGILDPKGGEAFRVYKTEAGR
ncbi:MAG: glycosyltransferase family 39 protein [Candidatus Sungiibacteriota bacterium]